LLETERNQGIQRYLSELSPSAETNYSLWKVTKRIKRPQTQLSPIRKQDGRCPFRSNEEKAEMFAMHFSKVFESHPHEIIIDKEKKLLTDTNTSAQMAAPAMLFTVNEVRAAIKMLNPKKAPGYDLITNQVLQKLPEKGIRFITQLCYTVLRQGFFPPQSKLAQIIMIQKLGKPAELAESYRSISLLPVLSKLIEKFLLSRLLEIIERQKIIPNHQFGF